MADEVRRSGLRAYLPRGYILVYLVVNFGEELTQNLLLVSHAQDPLIRYINHYK